MFKKRMLCIVMTLALLLTGLAGCGGDPKPAETTKAAETTEATKATEPSETTEPAAVADFELLLEAADAVLPPENFASVENVGGVNMIVCWDYEDVAHWFMELPADGTYTLRFVYSTDDDYEESKGLLYFDQNGYDTVETSLSFPATGDDDRFAIAETTVDLKKGSAALTIENEFTEDADFYFINLVKIQICQGNVPAPDLNNLSSPSTDPDALAGQMAGWWRTTPDLDLSYFLVNEDETSVILYDEDGFDNGPYDCRLEGDRFYISDDGEEEFLLLKDEQLVNPLDTSFVLWVRSETPAFAATEQPDFDGSWYHCGNTKSSHYDISDMTYRKMSPEGDSPAELGSGEVSIVYANLTDNTISYPHHLELELTNSDVEITPSLDGTMLIEEDFFEYAVYVREDLATEEMMPIYKYVEALLNDSLYEKADGEDTGRSMYFTANSFFIRNGNDVLGCGQWAVDDAYSLELTYEDGTTEYLMLPENGSPLYVGSIDAEFNFDF